ncbi:MAG: alpha-amylase [Clostridia bacterium]|nr:alpha-amylase [Clostridia bacterium]
MAIETEKSLRNQVMYSVFVRNYSREGTFDAVRRDLKRIRGLGTDIIWLMPIHPIGEQARKGTMGSPYAIRDYRAVEPGFGTKEDLANLARDARALGMRLIIDVVYNHTSPDSVLAKTHPEWFWHRSDGAPGNRFGDWADVIDLDYRSEALWDYQIETLKMWAEIVDGFRCDVASLVPLAFWKRARTEVAKVRPDALWLAESVEPGFIRAAREQGLPALSDSEIFQAFDIAYDYDIFPDLMDSLKGRQPLARYLDGLNRQESVFPDNYVKLRFLENHDRPRAAFLFPDARRLRCWTAFLYFQKGMTLIYAGQERGIRHLPQLFEKDPVDWQSGVDLSAYFRTLSEIKREPLFAEGAFSCGERGGAVYAEYRKGSARTIGVFPVNQPNCLVPVSAPDGAYTERISGGRLEVHHGCVSVQGEPAIFSA